MEYDKRLNLLINEIYDLYSLISNYQNNFFYKLDDLKKLQNNINKLGINLKMIFLLKEIDYLQLLINNFKVILLGNNPNI